MSEVLNRSRAERLLAEAGVDAVVATSYQNVFYLSGYEGFGQRLTPTTQVYAIARADDLGAPVLVAPISDLDMEAQFPSGAARIRPYGRFYVERPPDAVLTEELRRYERVAIPCDPGGSATEALLDELSRLPGSARVAVDETFLAPAARSALEARLGERLVPGAALLSRIRMVKTEAEVRRLEAAALAIEASYQAALDAAREGMSEAEMARVFDQKTVAQGSEPHFTVIAFGERGAFPNAIPSASRRLRPGDVIRFDIGCTTDVYRSDIARTAAFGEPSEKVRRYYDAILEGEERMLRLMRPGVTARELFGAAVAGTREAGIPHYRRHHVGHGVGLDTYDPPLLSESDETPLEAGMVFEIETPYYELGFAGLQVEDTVEVTEDGPRLLTRTRRDLVVLSP
jgi:Xaa-Pro aminopeptidase